MTRAQARRIILKAANNTLLEPHYEYRVRHLQEAVCKVRRFRLLNDDVLIAAGFNVKARKG